MTTDDSRAARTEAVRALEGEFSALITHVRRLIAENAERASPGLLPGPYKVLTTIARLQPVTLSRLADSMHIDKGQLSRSVRELEERDLVERSPDPADGRSHLIATTAFGGDRLAAARAPQQSRLLESLEEWPVDEIRNLTRLLHALTEGRLPSS